MKPALPLAVLLLVAMAHANEAESVLDSSVTVPPSSTSTALEYRPAKDPAMAYTLMGAATVLPIIASAFLFKSDGDVGSLMTAGAILVGPSVGQFYAGSYGTGLIGVGARTLGAYLVLASLFSCIGDLGCDESSGVVGVTLFFGGTLYSLIDTYFAVDRANERARKKAGFQTSFVPALFLAGEGRFAPGVALSASF